MVIFNLIVPPPPNKLQYYGSLYRTFSHAHLVIFKNNITVINKRLTEWEGDEVQLSQI